MKTQRLIENIENHAPPELEEGHEIPLADMLAEAGLTEIQIQAVEAVVEAEAERQAFHHAGTVLRRLFAHLAGCNTVCAALAHALGLTDSQSMTALAAALGFSKQSVGNMVARITPALGPLAVSRAGHKAYLRPTEPGEWLDLRQAAKLSGRTAQSIQAAAQVGELRRVMVGNRGYFEESDLLAWDGRTQLTAATEVWKHRQHRPMPNLNMAASPKLSEPPAQPGSCEPQPKTCTPNLPEARSA